MKNRLVWRIIAAILFAAVISLPVIGEEISVATLDIENLNGTSDLDYLKGMISGLLMFDLSSTDGVNLVDRGNLEDILAEQSLQLTGITEDRDSLLEIGRLGAADYLLKGTYVFLGTELLVSFSLLDTTTGEQKTFTGRGYTENTIHGMAEEIVLHLTGAHEVFQTPGSTRSILSLRDESPGEIEFFSPMINGEIYIDGEFAGYTTGNGRVPQVFDDLSPGTHNIMVKAGRDFGMVNLPEFTFEPWNTDVEVFPGKSRVVRDGTVDLNRFIYRAMQVVRESRDFDKEFRGTEEIVKAYSYEDRNGKPVEGVFSLIITVSDGSLEVDWTVIQGEEVLEGSLLTAIGKTEEYDAVIGDLECQIEGELTSYNMASVDYELWRRDIKQGMYRE